MTSKANQSTFDQLHDELLVTPFIEWSTKFKEALLNKGQSTTREKPTAEYMRDLTKSCGPLPHKMTTESFTEDDDSLKTIFEQVKCPPNSF